MYIISTEKEQWPDKLLLFLNAGGCSTKVLVRVSTRNKAAYNQQQGKLSIFYVQTYRETIYFDFNTFTLINRSNVLIGSETTGAKMIE